MGGNAVGWQVRLSILTIDITVLVPRTLLPTKRLHSERVTLTHVHSTYVREIGTGTFM